MRTSSDALQHRVGEWLGLFTVIELPKNQPSLSEEEFIVISYVMRHDVVIGGMPCIGEEVGVGVQEFVEGEGATVSVAALKSLTRCNCLVHKHMNMNKLSSALGTSVVVGMLYYKAVLLVV